MEMVLYLFVSAEGTMEFTETIIYNEAYLSQLYLGYFQLCI